MTAAGWRRLHLALGIVVVIGMPGASWIEGSRQLAWTMFNLTGSFRLEVFALGADGSRRELAPTELAAAVRGPAARFLAGGDNWRHQDIGRATLARHLAEVAGLGCRVAAARAATTRDPPPASVEVRLFERRDLDAPERSRTIAVACAASGG